MYRWVSVTEVSALVSSVYELKPKVPGSRPVAFPHCGRSDARSHRPSGPCEADTDDIPSRRSLRVNPLRDTCSATGCFWTDNRTLHLRLPIRPHASQTSRRSCRSSRRPVPSDADTHNAFRERQTAKCFRKNPF
jgi:hypothetical protein